MKTLPGAQNEALALIAYAINNFMPFDVSFNEIYLSGAIYCAC